MPFMKPTRQELLLSIQDLPDNYRKQREYLDVNARFFGSLRPFTKNVDRDQSIEFLVFFAKHADDHKNIIGQLIPEFLGKGKQSIIRKRDLFITNALTGALLWDLQRIDSGYYFYSPKEASALARVILEQFHIDKYSEVQPAELRTNLEAYEKYLISGMKTEWGKHTDYVQSILDKLSPYIQSLPITFEHELAEQQQLMAV